MDPIYQIDGRQCEHPTNAMKYIFNDDRTQSNMPNSSQFDNLVKFADQYTEPRNYREFGLALRDEAAIVHGEITGNERILIGYRSRVLVRMSDILRGQGFKNDDPGL